MSYGVDSLVAWRDAPYVCPTGTIPLVLGSWGLDQGDTY